MLEWARIGGKGHRGQGERGRGHGKGGMDIRPRGQRTASEQRGDRRGP